MVSPVLKAPFPYFGGKSRIAPLVWDRFGDVPNYVEPFLGSGAVLLGRPHDAKLETVNDKDGYVANFWRAVQGDPEGVAAAADWPVNEADIVARRKWCFEQADGLLDRLKADKDFYDAEIAGVWCWGMSCCIGNAWSERAASHETGSVNLASSRGVTGRRAIGEWIDRLSVRLRRVRVRCGDWSGVCSPAVTTNHGVTAMLLDPPYFDDCSDGCYRENDTSAAHSVRAWAIERGEDPLMRIALCGYEGEHAMPDTWDCVEWKAPHGFGPKRNAHRERVWFSPHCLTGAGQGELFLAGGVD